VPAAPYGIFAAYLGVIFSQIPTLKLYPAALGRCQGPRKKFCVVSCSRAGTKFFLLFLRKSLTQPAAGLFVIGGFGKFDFLFLCEGGGGFDDRKVIGLSLIWHQWGSGQAGMEIKMKKRLFGQNILW
jgi:hypothetical protein